MKFIFYSPVNGPPWDYSSLETGIGGSEAYHLEMATRLARRGHEVISYNDKPNPTAYEIHHGVDWRSTQNAALELSHLRVDPQPCVWVVQRDPEWLDRVTGTQPPASSTRVNWHVYHDVNYQGRDTVERMARYDRIIALSPFHGEYLEKFAGHKNVTVSSGGIAVDRMNVGSICSTCNGLGYISRHGDVKGELCGQCADGHVQRNSKRIIYASAPYRGLMTLLKCFERAKEQVADLDLHVYNGWEGFDQMAARDVTGQLNRDKEEMIWRMERTGAVWHGRVSQTELWTAYLQSGMWVYPTEFPEIFCAVAAEAQALGCIPIYCPTWALQNTVLGGMKIEGNPREDKLVRARFTYSMVNLAESKGVQDFYRGKIMEQARVKFDWERVVDQFEQMATEDLEKSSGRVMVATAPQNEGAAAKPETAAAVVSAQHPALSVFDGNKAAGDALPKDVFIRRPDGTVFGGWFGDENKRNLERLIEKHQIKTVAEIGCFLGYSSAWFARRVEKVYCIDLWKDIGDPTSRESLHWILETLGVGLDFYEHWRANMAAEGVFHKIQPLKGHSVAVAHLVPTVDLVYVDGDHSYAGCLGDIQAYLPKAAKVICGDDYSDQFPGVIRAVQDFFPSYQHDGPFWWYELATLGQNIEAPKVRPAVEVAR